MSYRTEGKKIELTDERLEKIAKYLCYPGHPIDDEKASMAVELLALRKKARADKLEASQR